MTSLGGFTNAPVEYFKPGELLTYTVGATPVANTPVSGVVPGTLLEFSGDRLVIPAAAGTNLYAGLATHDAAVGAKITVASAGVWPVKAGGVITAGARLITGAVGTVVVAGAAPDARQLVGVALEAIASGAVGRVKLTSLG